MVHLLRTVCRSLRVHIGYGYKRALDRANADVDIATNLGQFDSCRGGVSGRWAPISNHGLWDHHFNYLGDESASTSN